ncbi:MAG: polyprenyl synthetase family protein [Bdellovibrionales bacterium]|nr:polyprenyl synthetase family protein [Bdellovibrionales bacterium]
MNPAMNPWTRTFENALIAHVKSLVPVRGVLTEATLYALETPGKRIRPRLVEEASQLVSLASRPSRLLQFAVELIHSFSLVHDDLPCMDDDDFRREQPTVHKKFGEAQALLVGDLLFQLGMQTMLQASSQLAPQDFIRGAQFFTSSIGVAGLIGGQSTEFEKLGDKMTDKELLTIQDQKTSALFRASIITPFYWMGIGESDALFQDAINFASAFGFAFQIADDLEDAEQDGKAGTKNILSIYGADQARLMARTRLVECRLAKNFSATDLLLEKLCEQA